MEPTSYKPGDIFEIPDRLFRSDFMVNLDAKPVLVSEVEPELEAEEPVEMKPKKKSRKKQEVEATSTGLTEVFQP